MPLLLKPWFCLLVLAAAGFTTRTHAQSDPSNFTTVINVPPNTDINQVGSDTQVNVTQGELSDRQITPFVAGDPAGTSTNVEVNILENGFAGAGIIANAGSTVTVRNGSVNTSNGFDGPAIEANAGSVVRIEGDGSSVFTNSSSKGIEVNAGALLEVSGGRVDSILINAGGRADVSGSDDLGNIDVAGGRLDFSSPRGGGFLVRDNGLVVVDVAETETSQLQFIAQSGGTAILQSGSFDIAGFHQLDSGSLRIEGAELRGELQAENQSTIEITDGFYETDSYSSISASDLIISGGGFNGRLDVSNGQLLISGGSVGAGTPFDYFPPFLQTFIDGDSLVEISGGVIGGAETTGEGINLDGGELRISGGEINNLGEEFNSTSAIRTADSHVAISGGSIESIGFGGGSEVRISGGEIGRYGISGSSVVTQTGGTSLDTVLGGFVGEGEEILNLVGGDPGRMAAWSGTVNLFGSAFRLGGVPIDGLTSGQPVTIDERDNMVLSAVLTDGTEIEITLGFGPEGIISEEAVVTITLVVPGDYDNSGAVDVNDYTVWKSTFGTDVSTPGDGADGNFDGVVDAADFTIWRDNFDADATMTTTVPEPSAVWLLVASASGLVGRWRVG